MGEKTEPRFVLELCERYGTDKSTLWAVVKRTCIKPNKAGVEPTNEQVLLYLMTCHRYDLNPLMKEMYGFVDKDRQLVFGVGIDGWLKIANRHPQYQSLSVRDQADEHGQPVACTAIVRRKDREDPVEITEYLRECKRSTAQWDTRPARMLRHKATIQAIRYSFAITGLTDIEEAREAVRFSEGLTLGAAESRTEAVSKALDGHPAVQALPEGTGANGDVAGQQEPLEPPGEEEPYNSEESTDSGQPSMPAAPATLEVRLLADSERRRDADDPAVVCVAHVDSAGGARKICEHQTTGELRCGCPEFEEKRYCAHVEAYERVLARASA